MKKHGGKIFLSLLLFTIFGATGAFLWLVYIIKTLPPTELLNNRQVAESTKIYDRSKEILLYEIHGEEKRTIIPFDEIPKVVKDATIAVEDANFYRHTALDWRSVIRAFIVNLKQRRIAQGGSTITQQLAKKAFLSDERTISRKIKELILAIKLEQRFTKDQILEAYLNQIPYGSNAYGVEAASNAFFDKSTKDLSLSEAALLAGLPRAPTFYSPWKGDAQLNDLKTETGINWSGGGTRVLFERWDYVLNRMYQDGVITDEQKNNALKAELVFAKPFKGIKAPHFVIMIQDYLNKQYGEDFVRTNGLDVITTLDWGLQQLGEQVVEDGVKRNIELYEGKNAALVAQDTNTGQILALVGSRDYFDIENDGNFNVATQGLRQPGSAIKPFIYVTAFKKGFTPETIVFDLETEFDTTEIPEKSYKPGNFDEKFRGPINLRNALAQSVNVPAVKVLYLTGIDNALTTARNFGLTTLTERSRYGLSLVLGGGEVKLIDLVNAYSVFAEDGVKHEQSFILKISTSKGNILEEYKDEKKEVIDREYTSLVNDILSDNVARSPLYGPNGLLIPGFPDHQMAVKTGTTNDYRDAWTIGYTPSIVVGVWAGNNDNTPFIKKGSSILAAVPMWKAFMQKALSSVPAELFNKPEVSYVQKPILKDNYIVNYKSDNNIYPQIHNILFYVDKNDPLGPDPKNPETDNQFKNWEEPVIKWANNTISDFGVNYNQPLPLNSVALLNDGLISLNQLNLVVANPSNGDFITNSLNLNAQINSGGVMIKKIDLYLNDVLIDSKNGALGSDFNYAVVLNLNNLEIQNLLKVVVFDEKNNKTEKDIILFKQS